MPVSRGLPRITWGKMSDIVRERLTERHKALLRAAGPEMGGTKGLPLQPHGPLLVAEKRAASKIARMFAPVSGGEWKTATLRGRCPENDAPVATQRHDCVQLDAARHGRTKIYL